MLAKTMELGRRIESDPATAVLDLHVWSVNGTEPKARTTHPRFAHASPRSRSGSSALPSRPTTRWTYWSRRPGSA
jgi:hypothetical protein